MPAPTCRPPYLPCDSKTWYPAHFADNRRKVLPPAIRQNPQWGFFSANSFAPKKCGRSSKGTFPSRITFTRFVKALRKNSPVCPFALAVNFSKIWGKMNPKPAVEPIGKNVTALWTKYFEVAKQSISVGVRNRASFPLRMFHLEGRVIVDCEICNLVVAFCHSDSGLNITFV